MDVFVVVHQFEIRYSVMIDFLNFIADTLAPFSSDTTKLSIEDKNASTAKYVFFYENDSYSIMTTWDRIVFRYEGELDQLVKNNSIIEEPFFNIFSKIKETKNFGRVIDHLCYTMAVNTASPEQNAEKAINEFSSRYLKQASTQQILGMPTDLKLVIERKEGSKLESIEMGPYLGIEDLEKRKVNVEKLKTKASGYGEIAEIKIHEITSSVSFAKYKEAVSATKKIMGRIWK